MQDDIQENTNSMEEKLEELESMSFDPRLETCDHLLKIADEGEYEDLRREVQRYKDGILKKYDLIDYKGKFTVIQDKDLLDHEYDTVVGEITHNEALRNDHNRVGDAEYYGVSAYIGVDEELKRIYK